MIFVDTSFWIAFSSRRDSHHETAVALWEQERRPLVTSNHVVGETWTYLARKVGLAGARLFREAVHQEMRVTIEHVNENAETEAWAWLDHRNDRRIYSFVDATSFVTMRRRRMREALAFDGDFSAAGFVELRT